MFLKLLIFAVICVCKDVNVADSANILGVLPLGFASHFKAYKLLFEEMILQGHNLTLISSFPLSNRFQSTYKFVDVAEFTHLDMEIAMPKMLEQNKLENFLFCYEFGTTMNANILNSTKIQEIIQSEETFDLVLAELFCTDAFFAFGPKFNAPLISLTTQPLSSTHSWMLSNPFPSSYVPNPFLPMTDRMSFFSRFINTAFNFISILHYEFIEVPKFQNMIEKYFHFEEGSVPHIKDILQSISVSFVNVHHSLGYPKPNLPNVVDLAGIHMTPLKPLPMNIQNFMDGAEHGIIYVSLGSIVTPESMPNAGETIVNVLKNFPQKVIMKWDKTLLKHIPDNIWVDQWLPQADILNHPNCRLFITHGGLLGLLESLNASVPVLVIPFFGDQFHNMAMVEYFEIGLALEHQNLGKDLSMKVSEILNNEKYRRNMKLRSSIFHKRLRNPLETAMFWVDYVIQHKNSTPLKPGYAHLTWFELYSLDVLTITGIVILSIVYILKYIIIFIITMIWPKKIEKARNRKQD